MTVLKENKAGGVETGEVERDGPARRSGFRTYLVVGVAAAAIGVGAVAGANSLGLLGTDQISPAQIAQVRAAQFAENAESQYRAELARIHEQRAQDMVTFQRGSQGEGS